MVKHQTFSLHNEMNIDSINYQDTQCGQHYSCFQNLYLDAFLFPPGGYLVCQGSLKMDGYLFWTPVAPAMLTMNCLEKNDMTIKCST